MHRWSFMLWWCICSAAKVTAQDKPVASIPLLLQQVNQQRTDNARAKALLQLADAYILKPGEALSDMDTALLLVQQAEAINKDGRDRELAGIAQILLAKLFREWGQPAKGKQYALAALGWADKYNLPVQLAYANRELTNYFTWEKPDELRLKIGYLRAAAGNFAHTKRIAEEAQTLELLGDCLSLQGATEEALTVLHQSLDRYKTSGTGDLQGVHILLGRIYLRVFDYQQALRYSMAAVRSMESRKDTTVYWINIYNEIGLSYSRLLDHEAARSYFEKGRRLARRYKETVADLLLTTNIAQTVALLGRPRESIGLLKGIENDLPDNDNVRGNFYQTIGNVYLSMGKSDSAGYYLQQLHVMHNRWPEGHYLNQQYLLLANRYYLGMGQFSKLAANADSLRHFSLLTRDPVSWATAYYYQFKADSARGLYASALRHHVRLLEIRDSLQAQKKNRELNRLKIEFQTEQKDADIRALQQQQVAKDALLQRAGLRQRLIAGGSAVLLLLLGLLYSRYRIKRRSNRLLLEQKLLIDQKNASLQQLNQEQQQLLDEKEWLLREIHHRVRNNLQIVVSLLHTQSVYLDNDKAREAILQSQHRMFAMSLIHQRLYQAEHVSVIDMEPYVLDMVQYLQEDAGDRAGIRFVVNVEPIRLDAAQAVPVGLILNEAISNAVRHAFPDGRTGTITVALTSQAGRLLLLEVGDNGVGLPAGAGLEARGSMGLELIQVLSKQLEGELSIDDADGLRVRILFPADEGRRQRMDHDGEAVPAY